ncbi:MAG TPA: GNAT family N-acetyltransferase [Rubrobacter sp.]|nr:GNAT family N-acetyltransferase [Rubrobacter sp.]
MTPQDMANVRLVELDEATFQEYKKHLVRDYAADKVRAGAWSRAEAESNAAKDLDGLLPEGPVTRNHLLFAATDDSIPAEVGIVWFALTDSGVGRSVWIYDLFIHENFRRRGYASQTLSLVEQRAAQLGATSVGLHVFGHNKGAQALYKQQGFNTTSITMAKPI